MSNYASWEDEIVKSILFLDFICVDFEKHVGERKSSRGDLLHYLILAFLRKRIETE